MSGMNGSWTSTVGDGCRWTSPMPNQNRIAQRPVHRTLTPRTVVRIHLRLPLTSQGDSDAQPRLRLPRYRLADEGRVEARAQGGAYTSFIRLMVAGTTILCPMPRKRCEPNTWWHLLYL